MREDHTAFRMVARVDGTVELERMDLGSNPSPTLRIEGFTSDNWEAIVEWSQSENWNLSIGARYTALGTGTPQNIQLAREIDYNTGLISGFFQALNRNVGNDITSDMEYGPYWYNQAFRGIGVIVSESTWQYNIWDGSAVDNFGSPAGSPSAAVGGRRTQAIDPRLTPINLHGQVGMFTRINHADVRINAFTYSIPSGPNIPNNLLGGGIPNIVQPVTPPFGIQGRNYQVSLSLTDRGTTADYGNWLQGNDGHENHRFFIPNATVQDLR